MGRKNILLYNNKPLNKKNCWLIKIHWFKRLNFSKIETITNGRYDTKYLQY